MIKAKPVEVELTTGLVLTESGLHRPLVYKNSGKVFVEVLPNKEGRAFYVPDIQIIQRNSGNFITGDFDVKTQDEPIGITCMNAESATGSNIQTTTTATSVQSADPNPLTDGVAFHSLFFAAWQRHPNGTIKLNAHGRPVPAIDVNGVPMIGPLMLDWIPRKITVKNPIPPVGVEEAEDLTYVSGEGGTPETVYVGGWGGSGGGNSCAMSLYTLGTVYE